MRSISLQLAARGGVGGQNFRRSSVGLMGPTGCPSNTVAADGEGRTGVALNFVADDQLETVERRLRAAGFAPEGTIVDQEWRRSLYVRASDGLLVQTVEQDHDLYT